MISWSDLKLPPLNLLNYRDWGKQMTEYEDDETIYTFHVEKKETPIYKGLEMAAQRKLNDPEPQPTSNANPAIWSLVIRDMAERDVVGAQKYGTRLQGGNGRDMLTDAYQEALDLAVYLRGAIYERDGA